MATVDLREIITDRAQRDGRRKLRYKFTVTDNNGVQDVHYVGIRTVPASFDAAADLASYDIISRLQEHQIREDIAAVLEGGLPSTPPPFTSLLVQQRRVLRYCLSHRNSLDIFRCVNFLDSLTDARIKTVLDILNPKLANIRALGDKWRQLVTDVDGYVPEVSEE